MLGLGYNDSVRIRVVIRVRITARVTARVMARVTASVRFRAGASVVLRSTSGPSTGEGWYGPWQRRGNHGCTALGGSGQQ